MCKYVLTGHVVSLGESKLEQMPGFYNQLIKTCMTTMAIKTPR